MWRVSSSSCQFLDKDPDNSLTHFYAHLSFRSALMFTSLLLSPTHPSIAVCLFSLQAGKEEEHMEQEEQEQEQESKKRKTSA